MATSVKLGVSSAIFALVLALCIGLSAVPAMAQSATGTVVGQVTDQQNAVIAGADVKLVNTATSSTFSTSTNEVGRYTIPNVPPGIYDLTVSKTGFTAAKLSAQKVDVGQTLTLNVALQVGATTTTVEVQAAAGAELQTLNSTVGETITNEQLNLMPNLSRDVSTLSVLQVGVSLTGNVAGAASDQNAFQLDGGFNSDDMSGNNTTYTPGNGYQGSGSTGGTPTGVMPTPVESIEEFKVGTTGQTADFNGAAGSQVQMVTKRGTNQFHGAAYEYYFGSTVGGANLWRNNHTLIAGPNCAPGVRCDATPLPDTHRNRFGGALGGPLTPKFWGGKTYFFVNYEGMRFPNSVTYEKGVPTALMRAGVLTLPSSSGGNATFNLNPGPVTVNGVTYQPAQCVINGAAGACDPRGLGINPNVQKIWSTLPLPNDPTFTISSSTTGLVDGVNAQGFNGPLSLPQTSNFVVGRIDHDFGEKWKFMSSYRYYDYSQLVNVQTDIGGQLPGATPGQYKAYGIRPQKPSFFVAGLTTTINPNVTSDFRFSYLRNFWQWSDQAGPPQSKLIPGLGGALEIGGESSTGALIPYNVDSQDVRQRFWDGHDYDFVENLSQLHGNHLFQYGASYLRIFDYHGRNDNGVGIDTSVTYWSSGANLSTSAYTLPQGAAASALSNYAIMFNELTGIVNQTQVMYTRAGANLALQPLGTPGFDQSILPTYDVYFSDTWHIKPSLTLSYGLAWALEMPPYEINGKQVQMVDQAGNPIGIKSFLNDRAKAALQGQVFNPVIGFENIRNVGQNKYPFNPFYGGFSPHVSLAWNPDMGSDGMMGKLFGGNKTVIRGGYARIYGRLNGVNLLLVPLLGPGLLQATSCVEPLMNGTCTGPGGATPANAWRVGADGLVAPLPGPNNPSAFVTPTFPQPYFPGQVQNGQTNAAAADGSQLDPNLRPNVSDEFNFSIQRAINPKVLVEVGYIGRLIHDEFQEINLNAVPWMTTLNGQSFAQAYAKMYLQMCGGDNSPVCTPNAAAVQAQPFIEAFMGGSGSSYCAGFSSCTAAVISHEGSNIAKTLAYQVWQDLAPKSTLGRSMYDTGGAGQQLTGAFDFINSLGHSNYNAGYVSLTTRDWHGFTTRSNFTYGKALGTGSVIQASSSITVPNPYNFNDFGTYGVQPFDYKYTYSLLMLYNPPWFRTQQGLLGHVLGGWTIAPLFTARSGAPLRISTSTNGESFGEIYSGQTANYDAGFGSAPFTGGNSYHYHVPIVTGSSNPNGVATSGGASATGVNLFANPVGIFNEFARPVLGYDYDAGGAGQVRGFGFWDLDATLSRDFRIRESIHATLTVQVINLLNHFVPADPALNIDSPSTFGVVSNQYTQPNGALSRSMEFGLRLGF